MLTFFLVCRLLEKAHCAQPERRDIAIAFAEVQLQCVRLRLASLLLMARPRLKGNIAAATELLMGVANQVLPDDMAVDDGSDRRALHNTGTDDRDELLACEHPKLAVHAPQRGNG